MPGRMYAEEQGEFAQRTYKNKQKGKAYSNALATYLDKEVNSAKEPDKQPLKKTPNK